jgi:di/tripeptidase
VRDDASGLAGLTAAVSLMRRHDLTPQADTWFVASAREEIGLQGADSFMRDHVSDLGAFIAVDGQLGQISYAATGILWLKLHFLAGGGHTLKSHEKPSAILAAARAVERISAIPLRRSPEAMETWLNIGSMGGGDVPNAQARDAWFTVDLRSNDPATFEERQRRVLDIGRETAREIGVRFEPETMHRMGGGSIPGFVDSVLVRSARQVLEELKWDPIQTTPRGTADHNVAIVRGIPGIAIGVTTGDGAHTPEESADVATFSTGVKQILLLALMPLTAASP